MTFEELIERLKKYDLKQAEKTGVMTGEFAVLENYYINYCECFRNDEYFFLYGYIRALHAVGFISDTEREQLQKILLNIR